MKKILIGTHNRGKFREIAYLISKRFKKISPITLKIKSPNETGKTFESNSKLKANFFSNFVNFPVISDDSGLCIKSLKNAPGVYSARLAKKKGSFYNAMKYILKKLKFKKNRSDTYKSVILVLRSYICKFSKRVQSNAPYKQIRVKIAIEMVEAVKFYS